MNTQPTQTLPTQAFVNQKCQVQVGDDPNSLGHTMETLGKGHFRCKECKKEFVKIYRYNTVKDKGAKTGFDTSVYIPLPNFNKYYTEVIEKGDARTFKPRYIDWKIADEEKQEIVKVQSMETVTDILNTAILKEVIKKSGNWYVFEGSRFNGKKKLFSEISAMQLQEVQNKIQLNG